MPWDPFMPSSSALDTFYHSQKYYREGNSTPLQYFRLDQCRPSPNRLSSLAAIHKLHAIQCQMRVPL